MKKLLFIFAIICSLTSFGQVVFSENWDGIGPGVTGWTLYNVDALVPNAGVAFVNAAWISTAEEFDNKVAMSTSYYTPAGVSNDWIASPAIVIPSGTTKMYWDSRSYNATYKDSYKIFVSTTGNALASFTTEIFAQGDGVDPTSGENTTWTRRSVDLSAYAGQTINIAFQNFSNDMVLLSVDNIAIINSTTCTAPDRLMGATSVTQISATLNWSAVAGATSYDIAFGAPGLTPSVTYTSATPTYNLTSLLPNTRYQYYVRNSCGSQWIGPYSIFTAAPLPYVQGFETPAANGGFLADGWVTNGWATGTVATAAQAGTQYVFRNSSTTAATNIWLFSRPLSLSAGEQVTMTFYTRLGLATGTAHTLKVFANTAISTIGGTQLGANISVSGATYTLQTVSFTAPAAGTYYLALNNATPIVATATSLRLDTVNITSLPLAVSNFDSNSFSITPNPANDFVKVSSKNASISNIEMTDINGRIVKTVKVGNVNETELNISDLSSGVYMLKIASENGVSTKKIIKN